jgi:Fe-S cluster biogenesis protein NfuA
MASPERGAFRVSSERVEKLAARLEHANDPETRALALELVQAVVELHGAALDRLIDRCLAVPDGQRVLDAALEDDLVSGMFLLHSLHPDDLETRVLRGLESVRPYLRSHGGDCELIGVHEGVVRLRLHGSCGSCASSSATLTNKVEEALYQVAPDLREIVVEQAVVEAAAASPQLVVLQ